MPFTQSMTHLASLPIFMSLWSASAHMLSVMTPVKVWGPAAKAMAAAAKTTAICFFIKILPSLFSVSFPIGQYLSCEPCPAEHAQSPQGVPAARLAGLLHFEKHFARIAPGERPHPAVLSSRDQLEGVLKPRVARRVGGANVVEAAQHVVVPAGRKVEAGEIFLGDLAATVAAKQSVDQQELLAAGPGLRTRRPSEQRFQCQNGRVEGAVGGAAKPRSCTAVPSAVGHLCGHQMLRDALHAWVVHAEPTRDGKQIGRAHV